MAKKKLTALKTNMTKLNNSGTADLSVMLPVTAITICDEFKELFPLDDNKVKEIADNIREFGFDKSQPLHIWQHEGKNKLLDGHTRLAASKLAELYDVPVFMHHFDSVKDAQLYALNLQIKRRNLSSQQILIAVEKYDEIKNPGRKPEGSTEGKGRSSKKLADELGIGERTIQKARTVNNLADAETKKKIKTGEISLNKAYESLPEVKARKGKKKLADEDAEDLYSDALDDTSGNPSPLSFKQRKEKELSPFELKEKASDSERTKERKKAYELGYDDGFIQAVNYVLMQVLHGIDKAAIYMNIFCTKKNYAQLQLCRGDDPMYCHEYNQFRQELITKRKIKDLNPLPLSETKEQTESVSESETAEEEFDPFAIELKE